MNLENIIKRLSIIDVECISNLRYSNKRFEMLEKSVIYRMFFMRDQTKNDFRG